MKVAFEAGKSGVDIKPAKLPWSKAGTIAEKSPPHQADPPKKLYQLLQGGAADGAQAWWAASNKVAHLAARCYMCPVVQRRRWLTSFAPSIPTRPSNSATRVIIGGISTFSS